ncbi:AraC-like DNA-binding protein [Salinibacterium sp. CAN_S4]|uniref:helix-turn-helix domain-containing protein n=1 Tax=Salinibacterium sp. CAN_S4 TaxID=2787727 RepID=UPI0018EF51F4
MDVLADLLDRARARGAAFASTSIWRTEWGLRFPPSRLAIHVVIAGEAVITTSAGRHILRSGDIAAVHTTQPYSLSGELSTGMVDLLEFIASPDTEQADDVFVVRGDGPVTTFLCGAYLFDGDLCSALLEKLPEVMIVRSEPGTPISGVVQLIEHELENSSAGKRTVLDRLLDVLLINVLRAHFAAQPRNAPTWYTALRDPAVKTALEAMHGSPAEPMTVASLAQLSHVSRATLAQRFTELVGVPPLAYLTSWRMRLAKERLRESDQPLHLIALDVGYGSAYAFSAAFKRETGSAPGAWRKAQQQPTTVL